MSARILSERELWDMPVGARLVAIRWDLIQWALVLDLDVPGSESADMRMRRGWLVFDGVAEISWAMTQARLPTGCWISSGLAESRASGEFRDFVFSALLPQFDSAEQIVPGPHKDITVRALAVAGILSNGEAVRDEWGLSFVSRVALASDVAMLEKAVAAFPRP